jgi:glycosyltransferase involved in cell wall biosynthesis
MHILAALDDVGGTARVQLNFLRNSDSRDIEHRYVCMRRGALQNDCESAGASVAVIGSTSPLRIIIKTLQVAKAFQPDILSTHCVRSLVCGAIVGRILRVPFVHNEHGAATIPSLSVKGHIGRLLFGFFARRAAAVICNSRYTASMISKAFAINPSLLKVIYLPVERRVSGRNEVVGSDSPKDTLWVGHIGGMVAWRNQSTLVKALRILRDRGIDARLLLVGDGPMRRTLEVLTAQLQLQPWVTFLGYQTDLSQFYNRIEVYVNPAFGEAFGIANIESMLESKPVVLAAAGSHPELIEHGVSGLLYRARDPQSLAGQLTELAIDPGLRAKIGRAGCEHAERAFAVGNYVCAYQAVMHTASTKDKVPVTPSSNG